MMKMNQFKYGHHGKRFGFPKCCIDSWCNEINASNLGRDSVKYDNSGFSGTGFIPCEKCLNKSYDDLVAEINNNRDKNLKPFPLE